MINNEISVRVVSFNHNKVYKSAKAAAQELFKGNNLFYKKIRKIISGERKINFLEHPELGRLKFYKHG